MFHGVLKYQGENKFLVELQEIIGSTQSVESVLCGEGELYLRSSCF